MSPPRTRGRRNRRRRSCPDLSASCSPSGAPAGAACTTARRDRSARRSAIARCPAPARRRPRFRRPRRRGGAHRARREGLGDAGEQVLEGVSDVVGTRAAPAPRRGDRWRVARCYRRAPSAQESVDHLVRPSGDVASEPLSHRRRRARGADRRGRAAPPLRRNSATCALVACEQLRRTRSPGPFIAGSDAASPEAAVIAKLRGRPIARPELQTSWISQPPGRGGTGRRCRPRNGDRDRDAFGPQGVEARLDRRRRSAGRGAVIDEPDPTRRGRPSGRAGASCACRTRTRLASVIGGADGRACRPRRTAADEEMTLEDRAALSGNAGVAIVNLQPSFVHQRP